MNDNLKYSSINMLTKREKVELSYVQNVPSSTKTSFNISNTFLASLNISFNSRTNIRNQGGTNIGFKSEIYKYWKPMLGANVR